MTQRKIEMRKIKEIIRLYENNISQRDIGNSLNISKTAVQTVLNKYKLLDISFLDIENIDENDLEKIFYTNQKSDKSEKLSLDFSKINIELRKKGVTLQLLWSEYKDNNPDGLQYSRFCALYKEWTKYNTLVMRQTHKAGEKLFIDFSGLTIEWLNLEKNIIEKSEIFVSVLGASNYTFAYAVNSQSLENWIKSHVKAFEFYGGVPEILVPDNLKSGVTKACRYEPTINYTYNELAKHYNTTVIPARAAKPKDKAKAEQGVQLVQRWILANIRNYTFTSIEEINLSIAPLLEKLNNKIMQKYEKSRKELFLEIEAAALKELPKQKYEFATWKSMKVNIDYHVEIDKHFYSVPYKYCGSVVNIRVNSDTIEIFNSNKLIATHKYKNNPGSHTTIDEHLPNKHREYKKLNLEQINNLSTIKGGAIHELCKMIIDNTTNKEVGIRFCLGILRLEKHYTLERLELACKRALKIKNPSYNNVKNILLNKLDFLEAQETKEVLTPKMDHENIRGSKYYK